MIFYTMIESGVCTHRGTVINDVVWQ